MTPAKEDAMAWEIPDAGADVALEADAPAAVGIGGRPAGLR